MERMLIEYNLSWEYKPLGVYVVIGERGQIESVVGFDKKEDCPYLDDLLKRNDYFFSKKAKKMLLDI